MEKLQAIEKIKDLLRLSQSINQNEAESARQWAEKLKTKFQISDAELQDEETPFKKENILLTMEIFSPWRMAVASALADYFYCTLLQLRMEDQHKSNTYEYYLCGEEEDIKDCQAWYKDFEIRLEKIAEEKTNGRSIKYKFSFSQGLADGLNKILMEMKYDAPKREAIKKSEESGLIHISEKLAKIPDTIKETTNSKQESGQTIVDPYAYFYGVQIGQDLELPKLNNTKMIYND